MKSRKFGDVSERLARKFLMNRFPDLEVSPEGFDRSLGPADLVLRNPRTKRVRAVVQVKSGKDKACITNDECERLISQAEWFEATPYVLFRTGSLHRGDYLVKTAYRTKQWIAREISDSEFER